jgi:hypothetical protein
VTSRRAASGLLGVAALLPPALWLVPPLLRREVPSFRDQADFFFPLKLYTADRILRGELPLWNPLSACGEPWLANLQAGVFYPPGLLFLATSPALGAGLFLLLHFTLAAAGLWRFVKQEGGSDAAALAGAALYAGSGLGASLSAYWNHFGAFAWLPWLAALARGGLDHRRSRLGFAALFALQLLCGSPEVSAATLGLCALLVWKSRPAPEGGFQPRTRLRLGRLGAAAILGVLLGASTLAPFVELLVSSDRTTPLPATLREYGALGWEGATAALGISAGERGGSYFPSLFFGSLAFLLAAGAVVERERRPLVLLLGGVAVAGILLAAAAPPGAWLRGLPPLDRIRYPEKALVPAAFALSALAGLGLDAFRFSAAARRKAFVAAAAGAALLAVVFSSRPASERIVAAAGIAAVAGLAFAAPEGLRATLASAAALLLVGSLVLAGRPAFKFVPEAEIRRVPQSHALLEQQPGRVLTPPTMALADWVLRGSRYDTATVRRQREALMGYTNLLAGVRTIRSPAALATDAGRRIEDGIDGAPDLQRAAGAASARVLWTPFTPPDMGSRKVGEFYRAPINPYRPRLSFARDAAVEPDARKAWTAIAGGTANWQSRVFVDREPSPRPLPGSSRKGYLLTRIAEDRPEMVVAEASSDSAGILVLADAAYPGWRADVDGKPAEILRVDGCFRGVAIPAGSSRVTFRYRPLSFYAGAAVSLVAIVLAIGLAWKGEPRRAGAVL